MFLEPTIGRHKNSNHPPAGWIEVICGSMFSGKTEELIRRLRRALYARQKVEIFKPKLDTRYHHTNIVSHNETSIRSTPVSFANDLLLISDECDVIGIDEAQFFDEAIVEVSVKLANAGKRVIIAGLDMDFQGKPFGKMPELMAVAEFITKVHAICVKCGETASYSYRTANTDKQVLLGEKEEYEARCRKCFYEGQNKKQS